MRALASLGVLVTLIPSAGAGMYFPPPGDRTPSWSPDGRRIAFATGRLGGGLALVNVDGSGEVLLFKDPSVPRALSPDWRKVAFLDNGAGSAELKVRSLDGTQGRMLADGVAGFAWSPDSKRLAFTRANTLFVVEEDGSDLRQLAASRPQTPLWSPDGTRIAFDRTETDQRTDLYVVNADGSGETNLTNDTYWNLDARWSPSGRSLAFISSNDQQTRLEVIDVVRGNRRAFPVGQVYGEFGWTRDGTHVWIALDGILRALDISSWKTKMVARFPTPVGAELTWSPDGTHIAFASGGECRDRSGIYVARANGSEFRRITNDCRIVGTDDADELRGTELADVLVGLGGDDRLVASDPGYVGDTLEGGTGDDVLTGDYRPDTLEGGAGQDILRGGPSGDRLDGGYGRDRIDGEGGRDVVLARDGERDTIACGTNGPGTPELDSATVDYFDTVAADCEVVNGARVMRNVPAANATRLTISVWPRGKQGAARPVRRTLACKPARGSLPRAARACRRLLALRRPFRGVPRGTACTEIYGGPEVAEVRGRLRGRGVAARFTRTDGCQIERWNRVSFLFRA
jgi:Subtilisin inhibitor-like/RTX calcium-binding nonapeptide repeat (4 copies)/WD40-like Beta Propeller Repeat